MKWYFACRTRHTEKLVAVTHLLESNGETVRSDWVFVGNLAPFEENLEKVQEVMSHNTEAILDTDVFVLISDPEGTDMYTELGVALGKRAAAKDSPRIYIVGEHSKRSPMQLHPAIVRVETLAEVFKMEKLVLKESEIFSLLQF